MLQEHGISQNLLKLLVLFCVWICWTTTCLWLDRWLFDAALSSIQWLFIISNRKLVRGWKGARKEGGSEGWRKKNKNGRRGSIKDEHGLSGDSEVTHMLSSAPAKTAVKEQRRRVYKVTVNFQFLLRYVKAFKDVTLTFITWKLEKFLSAKLKVNNS